MKTILIIEDDENLNRGITFVFEKDGYSVISVNTLQDGQRNFEQNDIDIIILDLGLPDGNGIELCRSIRKKSNIPIIMLTAYDLEIDEVFGLMVGADDYITKPFSLSVLRARIETVFRRLDAKDNPIIQSGIYRLDTDRCKLYRNNDEISISATEFRLLKYLMSNPGQILSKEQILLALWDSQGNFVDENIVPVNISRLRTKIEKDAKSPKIIKTIQGMGYVWVKG